MQRSSSCQHQPLATQNPFLGAVRWSETPGMAPKVKINGQRSKFLLIHWLQLSKIPCAGWLCSWPSTFVQASTFAMAILQKWKSAEWLPPSPPNGPNRWSARRIHAISGAIHPKTSSFDSINLKGLPSCWPKLRISTPRVVERKSGRLCHLPRPQLSARISLLDEIN